MVVPKGVCDMGRLVAEAEAANLPLAARMPLDPPVGQFGDTKARVDAITADPRRAAEEDETARRVQTMPGIGPITASISAATRPDVSAFRSARDLSARLGLTPKPHSSGGEARPGAISKMGDRSIRRWLSLGAMGVISTHKRADPGEDRLGRMPRKTPLKVVALALANRMARQIWARPRTGAAWRAA